jgi:hypothetical protein
MFTWICPQCGREVPPSSDACPDCGASEKLDAQPQVTATDAGPAVATPAVAPVVAPPTGRVASHLRMVIVLWLAQGVLRILSVIPGLLLWFPVGTPWGMAVRAGLLQFRSPLGAGGWAFLLVSTAWTVACLVVAWSLVERAAWARTYTVVVSAIWLLDFPLGTALSIYTLWVLLPESSESEYRQLAMQ